ncbi:MAG: thioredoxin-disulfide reductase [Clostridiales bacterium]|nr:thioredoxin-disulfide reductase [Clostridiales bacterium]MCF8021976.1 thioredoxin-disulfide reductase [Clostridiales bacterium]
MEKQDIIIIGGGPAGLASGIYAARAALKTTLIEKGMPGGLVANTEYIENYPGFPEGIGGPELAMQMQNQAMRFGMEFKNTNVESIKKMENCFEVITEDGSINTSTVIMATGASPRMLGIEGEGEYHGRGVSYCATCDGALFRDKDVCVIGGGDAAVEEALFLTKFTNKVYIIHRRGELRATKYLQEKAMNTSNIEFKWFSIIDKIEGEATVKKAILKDTRDESLSELSIDGVFIYIGTKPAANLVSDIVKINSNGYIVTDEEMKTSQSGIYAVGDVREKTLRQVVTAVSDGAVAAVSAEKYIEKLADK